MCYALPTCIPRPPPPFCVAPLQKAEEDASHAAKTAAISAESATDSAKHEAKGFGARLWGRGQVRQREDHCTCRRQVFASAGREPAGQHSSRPLDTACPCLPATKPVLCPEQESAQWPDSNLHVWCTRTVLTVLHSCVLWPPCLQEAAEDVSAAGSKAGHSVAGAFNSAGSSIKGAADKVSMP